MERSERLILKLRKVFVLQHFIALIDTEVVCLNAPLILFPLFLLRLDYFKIGRLPSKKEFAFTQIYDSLFSIYRMRSVQKCLFSDLIHV